MRKEGMAFLKMKRDIIHLAKLDINIYYNDPEAHARIDAIAFELLRMRNIDWYDKKAMEDRKAKEYLKRLEIKSTIVPAKIMGLKEKSIKIRYAYLGSPTTMRVDDPLYCESLRFKVLSLAELEIRPNRIDFKELLTDGKEEVIRILGRDSFTGRRDMDGREIYEGDIIRWYTDDHKWVYVDETVDDTSLFYEQESERDCKIMGNVYEAHNRGMNK